MTSFDMSRSDGTRPDADATGSTSTDVSEAAYRPFLDGMDITDEQKAELIRIVWDIMRMCAELNVPADSCGQIIESMIDPAPLDSDTLL